MRLVGAVGFGLLLLGIIEVVVFILIAQQIGLGWAFAVAVVGSVLGGWLVRREGVRGWRRFRDAVGERRPPGVEASDGFVGLTGALLLAMPGFVSGAAGLLLLFPPVRTLARTGLRRTAERRIPAAAAGDLFGPRRVRRMPTPEPAPGPTAPPPATGGTASLGRRPAGPAPDATPGSASGSTAGSAPGGDVIEGEIIDPRA